MTPIGYNPNDSYFAHPYGGTRNNGHTMTASIPKHINKMKNKRKKPTGKRARERVRLQAKADSPGVPPNTCPYIDLVQTMVTDLQEAYERLRTRGDHNPVVDNISTQATDLLEYIRTNNETLRDNSAYWYEKYKKQLK